jgi:hypothetical protein
MTKYRLITTLIACGLLVVVSCKKKKNDNPFGAAKIATVVRTHVGDVVNYRLVYDSYNNIDSIVISDNSTIAGYFRYRKFAYFGTSYSITDETNTIFTVWANGNGYILKVFSSDSLTMSYTGNELAVVEVHTPSSTPPYYTKTSTNYSWKNGDLTGGAGFSFDYDNGRNGQPGDSWRVEQILKYGRAYIKTTHLVKDKMYGSAWVERYFYQYDGSGRISQMVKVGNNNGAAPDDSTVYAFTYY